MKESVSEYTDTDTLAAGINAALAGTAGCAAGITILDRQPCKHASTSPAEIVRCRFKDGSELALFCKHDVPWTKDGFGHRLGLQYEAWVYRSILAPLQASTPKFFGTYSDPSNGDNWMILEYLERCSYPDGEDARQFAEAARWIAQFHALAEKRIPSLSIDRLTRYDRDYYLGWVRRTAESTRELHEKYPWLPGLCDRFHHLVEAFCALEPTVIHGEYYYKNILFKEERVFPIDWESAALGPGEIDLAALTEGFWPPHTIQACLDEYRRTRWPDGGPRDFERRLDLAKLYLHFRWLGTRPKGPIDKNRLWRIEKLRHLGELLGIV